MNATFFVFGCGIGFGFMLAIFVAWSWIALDRLIEIRRDNRDIEAADEEIKRLRAYHASHIGKHE